MRFDIRTGDETPLAKEPGHLKRNVFIGYGLIVFFAIVSMFFIFNNLRNFVAPNTHETYLTEKSRAMNHVFFHLYDAECIVSEIIVTPEVLGLYQEKSDLILTQLDSLKSYFSDDTQVSMIDSIAVLLKRKEQNVRVIASLARQMSIDDIYRKNLSLTIMEVDERKTNRVVEHSRSVKNDTVTYKRIQNRKRSFFYRLANIFSSKETVDTTIKVTTSEYVEKDSVLNYYNAADSINAILENIKGKVDMEKRNLARGLNSKLLDLELNNQEINHHINVILHSMQNEDLDYIAGVNEERELSLQMVSHYMRYFAAASLLLGLLFFFMVLRDVSKGKRYRESIAKANAETLKLMADRENLMMGIAHDIKAPLSSVIGYIELMNNNKVSAKQAYYLNGMKASAQHIQRLVVDVLDFNRLDSGSISLSPIPFPCKELFSEVSSYFMPIAKEKNIEFSFECNCAPDAEILVGDPLRIKQIVTNLISNALKFTRLGSVSFSVSSKIIDKKEHTAELSILVKDTGMGIPNESLESVFDEYVRARNGEVAKIEGMGLGLSIVKKIVEMHRGTISVDSEVGKGSAFTVLLPLLASQNVDDEKIKKKSVSVAKILFIDDDNMQLTIMKELLRSKPVSLDTCNNVFEALALIGRTRYDMIFSDIQMPGMNGFEFVSQIRNSGGSKCEDVVVVALSARADVALSVFREHGFTDFLPKPFSDAQLSEMIKKYIDIQLTSSPKKNEKNQATESNPFAKMLEFAGGDKDAETEILNSFKSETTIHLESLQNSLASNDMDGINKVAHKMLAIFRLLGDERVSSWLSDLEECRDLKNVDKSLFSLNIEYIGSTYIEPLKE